MLPHRGHQAGRATQKALDAGFFAVAGLAVGALGAWDSSRSFLRMRTLTGVISTSSSSSMYSRQASRDILRAP